MCVCFKVPPCDSMSLLMKKLDHLNDGIQEGQGSDSSHADEEPRSAAVSHFKSTRPKSGLFINMALGPKTLSWNRVHK